MRRLPVLLAAVLLSLFCCSVAAAQLGPSVPSPLTQTTDAPPPPVVNPDASKDSGLSTLQLVLIFGSAMAVLAGIAWVILRDAHRAAPVDQHPQTPAAKRLSAHERERLERRRKQKAKAARRQRKRNRPR